jgi:uncharacterized membrane protein YwaF
MNAEAMKKRFLWAFVVFLGLTALIAIVSVLTGEFGKLQVKILVTSFTISATSICSMSCAAFIEKKRHVGLGFSGILLSVASAVLLIFSIWMEFENEWYFKITFTVAIFAGSLAHAFLLVLPDLENKHVWIQKAATISIGVLVCQIVVALWAEIDHEAYIRALAVIAIIVVLETLLVPLFMKLKTNKKSNGASLTLEPIGPGQGRYRDPAGLEYLVKKLEPGAETKIGDSK